MKRYLPLIIIALVAVGCLLGGFLSYRAKVAQLNSALGTAKAPGAGENTETPGEHVRGLADAPVTLEEFGDFQCPPCAAVSEMLERIEHDYGPKLRVIFRNFPLQMHAHADEAARVAEAAGLQGHFWQMHDLLYKKRDAWSKAPDVWAEFTGYATALGLDVHRLRADVESPAVRERVEKDEELGKSRGVSATPTIFINGTLLPPAAFGEPGIRAAIDAALKGEAPPEIPIPSPSPTAAQP